MPILYHRKVTWDDGKFQEDVLNVLLNSYALNGEVFMS